jgi:two-component system cell cycle response regulator
MARVLVIEDNPANLELMVYLLQAFGHTPLTSRDGRSGLEAARREAPDLILCDIQLPDIDGYEIARQIQADPRLSGRPLVAVTALAMVGDRSKALAAGFDGYITKPLVPETFVAQMEAFLHLEQRTQPTDPNHPAGAAAAPRPPALASVLVVDDEAVNVELLRGILEPSGYAVRSARTVAEALVLARQNLPDIIVSDLVMQPDSGYDFLRLLKADPRLSPIPVIIHSASAADHQTQAQALALGAARFVARPIEPEALLREIEACLRRAGQG